MTSRCAGGRTGLLSEERWAEMDWDNDGCITFKVCAIVSTYPLWCLHGEYSAAMHHLSFAPRVLLVQEFLSAMYEWVGVEEE